MTRIKNNFGFKLHREDMWSFKSSTAHYYQLANDHNVKYLVTALEPLIKRLNIYSQPQNFSDKNWIMTGRGMTRQLVVLIESMLRPEDLMLTWVANSFIRFCKDINTYQQMKQLLIWCLKCIIIEILSNEEKYYGNDFFRHKARTFLYGIIKRGNVENKMVELGIAKLLETDKFGNDHKVYEPNKLGEFIMQQYHAKRASPKQ
jgi:hypothetical protein